MTRLFDPQYTSLNFEVWFLIFLVSAATAYGLRVVTGAPWLMLLPLLAFGSFVANVAVRAWEWVPVTRTLNGEIIIQSTHAAFGGMILMMAVWFVVKLLLPSVFRPPVVRRPNEPKGVIGNSS